MERLNLDKFNAGQLLNDSQMQNVFGGRKINTDVGDGKKHSDEWTDKNGNGRLDKGDTVVVGIMAPVDSDPTYSVEELEAMEVEVYY